MENIVNIDENMFEIEEDMKCAIYAYKKYFYSCSDFRDDLIQSALLLLLKSKKNYNNELGSYWNYAVSICKFGMLKYLRDERKQTNNDGVYSLDFTYEDEEDTYLLADTIPENVDFDSKINYEMFYNICLNEISNNKSETFRKINTLFINLYTPSQIVKKLGITRQCVSIYIRKFQKIMREKYKFEDFI